jgi:riboflavin synthase
MFTGIIEAQGTIKKILRQAASARMTVSSSLPSAEITLGESIAVDGACLTVTELNGTLFTVDISPETLQLTTLGTRHERDTVNLERALRLSDRLGGHLVTGHIDGVAVIKALNQVANAIEFTFAAPPLLLRYLVVKGSVAIDGISLTVNQCSAQGFSVMVIPFTAQHTSLSRKKAGDQVNIETDIMGKYIEKFLMGKSATDSSISKEFLSKYNFT